MTTKTYYVYLIRSTAFPERKYVGFTEDIETRIKDHNRGKSVHTAKYRPWQIVSYHAFTDKKQAKEFEKYLKSGSGRAFAAKRLW